MGRYNDYRDQAEAALVLGYLAPYRPESQALFARMDVQPTPARKVLINNLIVSLINAGVWSKMECLWLLAAADAQAARLNWLSSNFTLTPVASPTFTADRGYAGDGSTSYLNTSWVHSSSTIALQNSTAIGGYINAGTDTASDTRTMMGAVSGGNLSAVVPRGASGIRGFLATSTGSNFNAASTNYGFTALSRTASNLTTAYRNNAAAGTASAASTARPSVSAFLCGRSNNGTLSTPIDNRIAAAFISSGLNDTEMLALYNAINTYLTAIGAN